MLNYSPKILLEAGGSLFREYISARIKHTELLSSILGDLLRPNDTRAEKSFRQPLDVDSFENEPKPENIKIPKTKHTQRFIVENNKIINDSEYIVFVLGAGSSKDLCFPICNDLFSDEYLQSIHFSIDGNPFKQYKKTYTDKGFEKVLMDKFENDPKGYRILLKYLQTVMLQADNIFSNADGYVKAREWWQFTAHYWIFLALIKELVQKNQKVAILSFNYDLCIEQLLLYKGFNYGTITSNMYNAYNSLPSFNYDFTILKLHGSFNFAICANCGKIWCQNDYLWDKGDNWTCQMCGVGNYANLYIPPLLTKNIMPLEASWNDAKHILSKATDIITIGYSLPEYDKNALELFKYSNSNADFFIIDPFATELYKKYLFINCKERYIYSLPFKVFATNLINTSWQEHKILRF